MFFNFFHKNRGKGGLFGAHIYRRYSVKGLVKVEALDRFADGRFDLCSRITRATLIEPVIVPLGRVKRMRWVIELKLGNF
jgi:hypothetical protein